MKKLSQLSALLGAMLVSVSIYAGDIQIEGAWSRATTPGQDAAMVDMTITSKQTATLVGVATPVAHSAELHSMTTENGMMKMRQVNAIELPAGQAVNLGEAGYHVMLIGLKKQLNAGDSVPVTLRVQAGKHKTVKIDVTAEVKPLTEQKAIPQQDEHMHMHHH